MSKKAPVTQAVRALKAAGVVYQEHLYEYEERGGTAVSSRELGVEEHCVIKTLVFEDEQKRPLIILMHGDQQVSAKELARTIGARAVVPCRPEVAEKQTGYKVGGTSPFGLRKPIPIYAEESIRALDRLIINGGARGFLIEITPDALERGLNPTWVKVGRDS